MSIDMCANDSGLGSRFRLGSEVLAAVGAGFLFHQQAADKAPGEEDDRQGDPETGVILPDIANLEQGHSSPLQTQNGQGGD